MDRREENKARLTEAAQRVRAAGIDRLIPPNWGQWRHSGDEIRCQWNNRSINARSGAWRDLRNSEKSGDLLSFIALEVMGLPDTRGQNFTAALERLCAEAGMPSGWQPTVGDAQRHAEASRIREAEDARAAVERRRAFGAFCRRIHERRRAIV